MNQLTALTDAVVGGQALAIRPMFPINKCLLKNHNTKVLQVSFASETHILIWKIKINCFL